MIDVQQLRKTFRTKEDTVPAIADVSFTVKQGDFFTLLGPSGCGKSTTLRSLAGLERPDGGLIAIDHTTVFSSAQNVFVPTNRRAIGMVFQSYAIWPHMTVFGNVAYPLKVKGVSASEVAKRVNTALELVGLAGHADRPAPRLSGGQQQRVALARALVAEPKVLLLDEPLSNLDAKLRAQMRVELKRLQSRLGITTIYVTHDQEEALAMSNHVAVMNQGKIVQLGAPTEIYHRPQTRFTAEFIGTTNLVTGKVSSTAVSQGLNRVETNIGPIVAYSPESLSAPDGRVSISIRPEAISILDENSSTSSHTVNSLRGRVETVSFLGTSVDCDVRIGSELLRLKTSPFRQLPEGAEVQVHLPPELCTIVAETAAPSSQTDPQLQGAVAGA